MAVPSSSDEEESNRTGRQDLTATIFAAMLIQSQGRHLSVHHCYRSQSRAKHRHATEEQTPLIIDIEKYKRSTGANLETGRVCETGQDNGELDTRAH